MPNYSGLFALFLLIVALVLFVRYEASHEDEEETEEIKEEKTIYEKEVSRLDLNDEDATVASLIAAIDYRKETGKNVRIVSIREVK